MPEPIAKGLSETARVEAFSDGVFAIAITLLVLEIQVPAPDATAHGTYLLPALFRLWPSYLGYQRFTGCSPPFTSCRSARPLAIWRGEW
jgi:transmembrane protein TMEM174 (potassium channel)